MKAISIISIPVTDQQRAKEFYEQIGFNVVTESSFSPTQRWIQMALPEGDTTITLVNWFETMPAGCIRGLVITTDDIVGEVKVLTDKGILAEPIEKTPWGRFAAVKDPDGNVLSLHQA